MNNDKKGDAGGDFPTIEPAVITLTPETPAAADGDRRRRSPLVWAALALLLLAVAGVIFVLPGWVGPASPPPAASAPASSTGGPTAGPATPAGKGGGATPWSEAQQTELRKQSQALLQQMLDLQQDLKQHHVEQWAGDSYKQALETAQQGDDAYAAQQFEQALAHYRQAREALQGLKDGMPQVYADAMAGGRQALVDGDAKQADTAFATALLIRPGDTAAQRGKQRAATLDQVLALIDKGDQQRQNGQLQAARESYAAALDLDKDAGRARQGLEQVNTELREQEYRRHMSAGYAALEQKQPEQARAAFKAALQIKAGDGTARAGLEQAEQQITNRRIEAAIAAARQAAAGEDWQAAVDQYRQALSLDASLTAAQEGLRRTQHRLDLDRRLQETINNPLRLADDKVYEQARALGREALAVDQPGPRLKGQIADLARVVRQAGTPVTVPLRSDNQTRVTIYKVADLDPFEATSVSLTPGHYVAVGSRPGYRDVRVEFTVRAGQPPDPVVIQVSEKIP